MARLTPDDIEPAIADLRGHRAEARTLGKLRDDLGDEYTVYHGVH